MDATDRTGDGRASSEPGASGRPGTGSAERDVAAAAALLDRSDRHRRRAALSILPFLFVGLFDLVLLLGWGLDPLWGFMILPPILFICALGWIAFSTGFVGDGPDGESEA